MLLSLVLQHFRNYTQKKIGFGPFVTVIVGLNTAGKTNLCEAIRLLATGKSFKAEKDNDMIAFGQDVARVQGLVREKVKGEGESDETKLDVTIAAGMATGGRIIKKYAVNGIAKGRNHFVGFLPSVLFRPEDLDIIIDGPSLRRDFLDDVLEPIDNEYRNARLLYDKALRQRNALLDIVKETGKRNEEQFSYWDDILIANGAVITQKREAFIAFINSVKKDIFDIQVFYDKSIMSKERLSQYKDAEIGAGNTLVGPQRDDFWVAYNEKNVAQFGSRGQQRLVILQLKLLQLAYMERSLGQTPLLVLDDIFSELDERHIGLVFEKIQGSQVIMTTTHKEFIDMQPIKNYSIIKL